MAVHSEDADAVEKDGDSCIYKEKKKEVIAVALIECHVLSNILVVTENTQKSRVDARVNQVLIYSPTMTTMCVTVHFSLGASNSTPAQASSSSSSNKLQVLELTRKKNHRRQLRHVSSLSLS
jgi:hypothetical protein